MISLSLGFCAAGLVAWAAYLFAAHDERIRTLPLRHTLISSRRTTSLPLPVRGLEFAGRRLFRLPGIKLLPDLPQIHRAAGAAVMVCPVVMVRSLPVAIVFAVAIVGIPVLRIRKMRAKRSRSIEREMPIIVDLLHLSVQSGLTVRGALSYVVNYVEGPVSEVYRQGLGQLAQGRRLAEVLLGCQDQLGESAQALTLVLLSAERYGSPLDEMLAQLARETRQDQERQVEKAARQLSVQLLFPVAGCILPAFALLTAAPLLAGSLGTLAF